MSNPTLTIGIISCNRLYYLKALVESLRVCINPSDVQWIIIDNASVGKSHRKYIESLDFIEHKIFRQKRNPSYEFPDALNTIIERADGKYMLPLTDDLQLIAKGNLIRDYMEIAESNEKIGSIVIDAQRQTTVDRYFGSRRKPRFMGLTRPTKRYTTEGIKPCLFSYGKQKPGVVTALINAITPTDVWRRLGPTFQPRLLQTIGESAAGFEIVVQERYEQSGMKLERCLAQTPIMAQIYTDMRGNQGRVRGNRRYGNYWAPTDGALYYKIWNEADLDRFMEVGRPLSFEESVQPIGFRLPMDENGDLLKTEMQEGDEFEWIHPSVEGIDIR